MHTRVKDSTKHVNWDARGGYYVARFSAVPTWQAEGTTPAEAINNLDRTYAALRESYQEETLVDVPPISRLAR